MFLKLNRETNRIKNGWSASIPILGLAAHGYSPEAADKNLERVVRMFLAPFEREGTLLEEARALGLGELEDLDDVQIVLD